MAKRGHIGQRYETVGASWLVWEVVEIVQYPMLGMHVVLRRVNNPETAKTVSAAALEQTGSYRLLSEA